MKSLYICYLPIDEPLVETQVLAYLRGLAADGHEMHLLTFETQRRTRDEIAAISERLASKGVTWHRSKYHKKPSLPATVWDTLAGAVTVLRIARRHNIEVLHARNHVPGMMALIARRFRRVKLIFDIRGVMAQEYIDGGMWKPGSLPVRITEWVQHRCIHAADGIVILTERARESLFAGAERTASGAPIFVIPSCADVEAIAARRSERSSTRARLGFTDERVLIYVGKFSTWYMAAEMARFYSVAARLDPQLRFLIVTQSDPALISTELEKLSIPVRNVQIMRTSPDEVGAYLGAADLAISFINPAPSKLASSPTKIGEYLAAGLPMVVNEGIGDIDALLDGNDVGVIVNAHSEVSYRDAASRALSLATDISVEKRCLEIARRECSLEKVGRPRYAGLYRLVQSG